VHVHTFKGLLERFISLNKPPFSVKDNPINRGKRTHSILGCVFILFFCAGEILGSRLVFTLENYQFLLGLK